MKSEVLQIRLEPSDKIKFKKVAAKKKKTVTELLLNFIKETIKK